MTIFATMNAIRTKQTLTPILATVLLGVFLVLGNSLHAQKSVKDSVIDMKLISMSGAFQNPGGDMADRFGANFGLGLHFHWKTDKNWIFGAEGAFVFGPTVRELNILDALKTEDGNILTDDGRYGNVIASERGWHTTLSVGRIVPLKSSANPNSGLVFSLGVGYIQHKIRYDIQDNNIPGLAKEYLKGYDRLSGGLYVTQFVGYRYFSNRRLVNFFAGFEFGQGFTKSLRSWNYDTNSFDSSTRFDFLGGVRAGWTFPIYRRVAKEFYIY